MDFGRFTSEELNNIDFTLPPDHDITNHVLSGTKPSSPFEVNVGSNVWGRKEWKGLIYPPKIKDADFLSEYVKSFNSIELNSTFYNIYGPDTIAKWKDKAAGNPDFKFFPKFPQQITHIRRLKNVGEQTDAFYRGIDAFEDRLGPAFLQLSDNFTTKASPELLNYIESIPAYRQTFVEIRHKGWFTEAQLLNELFAMLYSREKGMVITDAPGRRDCAHMALTTPHAFIRFVGVGGNAIDHARLDVWVDRIDTWRSRGLQSLNFFVHEHSYTEIPALVDYLAVKLNDRFGLNLPRPKFMQ